MKRRFLAIGDKVELLEDTAPYYSNYGGNPKVVVPKGTIGTVMAINVPKIRHNGSFNCVDFVLPGIYNGNPKFKHCTWRCSLSNQRIKRIK